HHQDEQQERRPRRARGAAHLPGQAIDPTVLTHHVEPTAPGVRAEASRMLDNPPNAFSIAPRGGTPSCLTISTPRRDPGQIAEEWRTRPGAGPSWCLVVFPQGEARGL